MPRTYLFCLFVRNVLLFQNSHALLQVLHDVRWRFVGLPKRERHGGRDRHLTALCLLYLGAQWEISECKWDKSGVNRRHTFEILIWEENQCLRKQFLCNFQNQQELARNWQYTGEMTIHLRTVGHFHLSKASLPPALPPAHVRRSTQRGQRRGCSTAHKAASSTRSVVTRSALPQHTVPPVHRSLPFTVEDTEAQDRQGAY